MRCVLASLLGLVEQAQGRGESANLLSMMSDMV